MSNTRPGIEEIRHKAREIADRARHDSSFMARLRDDPEGTLHEAGLAQDAIGDFMREEGLTPDVIGYMLEELQSPCGQTCINTQQCDITLLF